MAAKKNAHAKKSRTVYPPKSSKVYDITVTVRNAHRSIWRSIFVADFMPLDSFHNVLQALFGWSGGHIYYFERPSKKLFFDDPDEPDMGFAPPKGETHKLANEGTVKDLLPRKGSKAVYVYDMGDFWQIDLRLNASIPLADYGFQVLPACVDGDGASPPEDVGGPFGYEHFCEIMADENHPQHWEMMEWAGFDEGEVYDEAWFSTRDINTVFADGMIAANPQMIPDDPDELRRRYAELLADSFVMDIELQLAASMAMAMLESLSDETGLEELYQ